MYPGVYKNDKRAAYMLDDPNTNEQWVYRKAKKKHKLIQNVKTAD